MAQDHENAALPEGLPAYPNSLPRPEGELEKLKAAWALPKGWRILSAVNNTIIGYFYIGTAFLFFLLAGVLALLMRLQLAAEMDAEPPAAVPLSAHFGHQHAVPGLPEA